MKKSKKIFFLLLLLFFLSVFVFSFLKLFSYFSNRHEEEVYINDLVDQYEDRVSPGAEGGCPIRIDFDKLSKQNPDIVAWIYSDTLKINYPVVQGKDNFEYLRKGFDGRYLFSGTLFIDSMNSRDFTDPNTIIYGHNMRTGTAMFSSVWKYRKQSFYDENKTFWLLTPTKTYKLLPFCGKIVKANDESYLIFDDKDKFYDYIYRTVNDSLFKSEVDVTSVERVVTLSTCTYEFYNARFVLVCKLEEFN